MAAIDGEYTINNNSFVTMTSDADSSPWFQLDLMVIHEVTKVCLLMEVSTRNVHFQSWLFFYSRVLWLSILVF